MSEWAERAYLTKRPGFHIQILDIMNVMQNERFTIGVNWGDAKPDRKY
jgi:hypothetical protein